METFKICSVDDCEREALRKELCNMHYSRTRRNGSTERRTKKYLPAKDGLKECHQCELVKDVNQFHVDLSTSDNLNRLCKDCRLATDRRRRANRSIEQIEKDRQSFRESKNRHKEKLDQIKLNSGCVDCGYNKHVEALDFDHIENNKSFSIATAKSNRWEVLEAEIAKCEVVCSNCHRVRTANRRLIGDS